MSSRCPLPGFEWVTPRRWEVVKTQPIAMICLGLCSGITSSEKPSLTVLCRTAALSSSLFFFVLFCYLFILLLIIIYGIDSYPCDVLIYLASVYFSSLRPNYSPPREQGFYQIHSLLFNQNNEDLGMERAPCLKCHEKRALVSVTNKVHKVSSTVLDIISIQQ